MVIEMRKKLANKDIIIQELQAQLNDRKIDFHSRKTSLGSSRMMSKDSSEISVADEMDSICKEVGVIRATFVRPFKVNDRHGLPRNSAR